jgi:poly(A) polymerase
MAPRELADRICRVLRSAGHQAYLVGGCVRDLLLGHEPDDFDVATDANPDRVLELFPGSITVGAQYGVILVLRAGPDEEAGGAQVEVATFRSDLGYSDGRRPHGVVFSRSPEEDVRRRDFTINGLLMDPQTGEVSDFVGGRADIAAGIVRAIGDPEQRFAEDRLRMLRAVRFAARFSYAIEPATLAAIVRHAPQVHAVSAERVREELTRILIEGAARRGFELLDQTGLLEAVLPEIARMKGVQQPPQFHPEGDVWTHTLMLLDKLPAGASPTLAWGALLHDVGKPPTFSPPRGPGDRIRFDGHVEVGARMAGEIARRLRFSGDETTQVVALVSNHMRFLDALDMRPATLKRFVRLPQFDEHLELHRMDCLSSNGKLDSHDFVRRFLEQTPPEAVRPPRLITGTDLAALGLSPGPRFREILTAVEEAQLEGQIATQEEALRLARLLVADRGAAAKKRS